jgi:hypothetical protein
MNESSPTITAADQRAWEAPALRPTFTPEGGTEKWAHPCPDWCTGTGEGHDLYWATHSARYHRSASLRVRQDAELAFESPLEEADGVYAGHLDVSLVANSRALEPKVWIVSHYGTSDTSDVGNRRKVALAPLYPDEVRELISVLQHLLKVAQA